MIQSEVKRVLSKFQPQDVTVTEEGSNLSITVVSEYFEGMSPQSRKKEVLNVLQYENRHIFGKYTIELKLDTPQKPAIDPFDI